MKYPVDFTEEMRKQGICGVLAIAVAAGVTMARAHEVCKRNMMPHQKRHIRATYDEQILASLAELGVTVTEEYLEKRRTVRRWIEDCSFSGHTYLVFMAGHVVLVNSGRVLDQSGFSPVLEHRVKRCFVQKAYRIS